MMDEKIVNILNILEFEKFNMNGEDNIWFYKMVNDKSLNIFYDKINNSYSFIHTIKSETSDKIDNSIFSGSGDNIFCYDVLSKFFLYELRKDKINKLLNIENI